MTSFKKRPALATALWGFGILGACSSAKADWFTAQSTSQSLTTSASAGGSTGTPSISYGTGYSSGSSTCSAYDLSGDTAYAGAAFSITESGTTAAISVSANSSASRAYGSTNSTAAGGMLSSQFVLTSPATFSVQGSLSAYGSSYTDSALLISVAAGDPSDGSILVNEGGTIVPTPISATGTLAPGTYAIDFELDIENAPPGDLSQSASTSDTIDLTETTATPEPNTIAIVALALGFSVMRHRRT